MSIKTTLASGAAAAAIAGKNFTGGVRTGYNVGNFTRFHNTYGTARIGYAVGVIGRVGQTIALRVGTWARQLAGRVANFGKFAIRWLGEKFTILHNRAKVALSTIKTRVSQWLRSVRDSIKTGVSNAWKATKRGVSGAASKAKRAVKAGVEKVKQYEPARQVAEAITSPVNPKLSGKRAQSAKLKRDYKVQKRTARIRHAAVGLAAYGIGAGITASISNSFNDDSEE